MTARENDKRDRRDWLIILLVLLFGFLCILLAGGWALRFSPSWRLDTSMGSRLDPNSDFINSQPNELFDPLDSAILTQPAWIDVFLTPGASIETGTPVPTSVNVTPIPSTPTTRPPATVSPTNAPASPSPTNTFVFIPPTRTNTPGPSISANLGIVKTDFVTTYIAGSPVTYTIVVFNLGPNSVTGAVVSDPKPSQVTTWQWVCTNQNNGANGCSALSGNANFNDTVFLPAGGSITYTVTANIAVNATGNLVNTASVSVPPGYTDPNGANNSSTDTDTFPADLQITKDDGVATYIANGTTTYTVIVTNNGPNAVTGAVVSDTKPAQITNWSWACTAQTGGATGCTAANIGTNFTDTVNLPNGASITYTVTANISSTATGNLNNTATVNVPAGYTDPNAGNNFDIDIDTYAPSANLAITKTDGTGTYAVGGNNTLTPYTITVTNNGPDDDPAAVISDVIPSQITNWSWACTAQTGGASGCTQQTNINSDFNDTVNLPSGASITYTVTADFSPAATGNLDNTATVTSSITDPVPGNDSDTDTNTPVFNVNLGITKTDGAGVTTYTPGTSVTYTIVVSNAGPADATNALVTDTFPASVNATWTCVATGGASCTAGPVSGNISDTVDIPVGDTVTYTVIANIASSATGPLSNMATVTAGGTDNETTPGNNSATDTDAAVFSSDLAITSNTDNSTHYTPDATKTYTIVVSNAGPSDVTGATFTDNFNPSMNANITSWTCSATGLATCAASGGAGNINDTVDIPVGSTLTYTVTATVIASPAGTLDNTASIFSPTDPNNGNDSITDSDTLITTDPPPPGTEIGPGNGTTYNFNPANSSIILAIPSITRDGNTDYDLVYYELAMGTGILMDNVIVQISDGNNWYTVLNWGNGASDANTSISVPLVAPPNGNNCAGEPDNCEIDAFYLRFGTGVQIDIDSVVPNGTYMYIRIESLASGDGDGADLDSIEVLP